MKSLILLITLAASGSAPALGHGIEREDVTAVRHIASRSIETRELAPFHAIRIEGVADLFLAQGPRQQVQVDAEEGMPSHVTTTIENGVLVITTDRMVTNSSSIKVYVTLPVIDEISLGGTGNVIGLTEIAAPELQLTSNGTGTLTLNVTTKELTSALFGTGTITLSGKADRSSVTLEGTGDYHGRKLVSNEIAVINAGTGDVEVNPKQKLRVQLNGTGDVRYAGDVEQLESKITGTGALRKLPKPNQS